MQFALSVPPRIAIEITGYDDFILREPSRVLQHGFGNLTNITALGIAGNHRCPDCD
jgi:hypothetical protein